jgi:hypothetical protein
MNPIPVVVVLKGRKFSFQITGIPEKEMIEVFSSNGANQSFNKRM